MLKSANAFACFEGVCSRIFCPIHPLELCRSMFMRLCRARGANSFCILQHCHAISSIRVLLNCLQAVPENFYQSLGFYNPEVLTGVSESIE